MAASAPARDAKAHGHAGTGLGGPPGADASPELTQHILDLIIPSKREAALLFLSKHRERFPRLAPLLWWSFGTMSALLQEIVAVYPALTPATLTAPASNRVCNALALLQCVASHRDTRASFLEANIALYLYPFLRTTSKAKPFEYLRLTSLGVIGALVKQDDPSVVSFLVATEIIPLSLKIMETGSELSKTVAVFILERIVHDKHGLTKVCATQDRFFGVAKVLEQMVRQLEETASPRLLKHVIRCYERLASHPEACKALRECLPRSLQDATFHKNLENDRATLQSLTDLVARVRRD